MICRHINYQGSNMKYVAISTFDQNGTNPGKTERKKPVVEVLHCKNEIEQHSISYYIIYYSKSYKPSKLTDIDLGFHTNHDQHKAPRKRL